MSTIIYPSPIFGPVHSRRLGVSLGINLLPEDGKFCTFDCISCECGFNEDHRPKKKMCIRDSPETADTLEGNAMLKAEYIFENYGLDCFADDTGLEVEALNGAPGVYSARYAGGEGHNAEANMQK